MSGSGSSKTIKEKEKDKKRNLKSPKDGGRGSEDQSSASQSISFDYLPEEFSFLWSIDAIETFYDGRNLPRVLGVGDQDNDVAELWFPPNRSSIFRPIRKGNLYRWTKGHSVISSNIERPRSKFGVTSIFFQERQNNFVACHTDCTREDVSKRDVGWCYLGFNHLSNGLSEVDICHYAGPRSRLAAPARGSLWMPQALPEVYDFNTKGRKPIVYNGPPGGLCGRLAVLIGMAAFSADVDHEEEAVAQFFGFREWRRHSLETGIGRYQERGVVVSIYLDPDAVGTTPGHLRAFEKGRYGPIFATDRVNQEPSARDAEATLSYMQSSLPYKAPKLSRMRQAHISATSSCTVPSQTAMSSHVCGYFSDPLKWRAMDAVVKQNVDSKARLVEFLESRPTSRQKNSSLHEESFQASDTDWETRENDGIEAESDSSDEDPNEDEKTLSKDQLDMAVDFTTEREIF